MKGKRFFLVILMTFSLFASGWVLSWWGFASKPSDLSPGGVKIVTPANTPDTFPIDDDYEDDPLEVRLMANIEALSSQGYLGRQAGTSGEVRTAGYLEESMRMIGLIPYDGKDDLRQGFIFFRTQPRPPFRLVGSVGQETVAFSYGQDFSEAMLTGDGIARGNVIFAGYGLVSGPRGYNSYRGIDARGKVVLILGGGPKGINASTVAKVTVAQENGAAALLIAPPPGGDEKLHLQRTYASAATPPRIPVLKVSNEMAEWLLEGAGISLVNARNRLKSGPFAVVLPGRTVEVETHMDYGPFTSRNLVALLPGEAKTNGRVMVGAHYDHLGIDGLGRVFPGAEDNASGVAAVLELGRLLREDPKTATGVALALWSAEEGGSDGAKAFVAGLKPGEIEGYINLDMIGAPGGVLVEVYHWSQMGQILAGALRARGIAAEIRTSFGPSDSRAFISRGIPTVQLRDAVYPHSYHTIDDLPGVIDPEKLSQVTLAIRDALRLYKTH